MDRVKNNLENQFQELEKHYKKVPKRKWLFRLSTLLFLLFSFVMMLVLSIARDRATDKIVKEYISSKEYDSLRTLYDNVGLRGNKEAYSWFNENYIGIDTNTALAGVSVKCGANLNNRNIIGNVEAYTTKSKSLVIKVDGKKVHSSGAKVVEVIATPEDVFFIDETRGNSVIRYHIEDDKEEVFISEATEQFFVYGNYIFSLGKDEKVKRFSIENKDSIDLADNVQRMFICNGVIVQSGVKIIKIKFDGSSSTELVSDALLVGADDEHIYYTNFGIDSVELLNKVSKETEPSGDESQADNAMEAINNDVEKNVIQGKYVLFAFNIDTKKATP